MNKIDLSYLEEITGGENEIIVEMIDLFLEETPKHIENIKSALQSKNWKTLAAEAHKLKPTLLYVGLKMLHAKTQKIEEHTREGKKLDEIPELITDVEKGFNEAVVELKKKRKELSG